MPYYDYYTEVFGYMDGTVKAKNKEEAKLKVLDEVLMEGVAPVKDGIHLQRLSKEEADEYAKVYDR